MKKPFDAGSNPRAALGRHAERGPKKFTFTYQAIADAVGLKVRSVQSAKSRGDFDPEDITSVALYIAKHLEWYSPSDMEKLQLATAKCGCGATIPDNRSECDACFNCEDQGLPEKTLDAIDTVLGRDPSERFSIPKLPDMPAPTTPEVDDIVICEGVVSKQEDDGPYRCEDCAFYTYEPPKLAVHPHVDYPKPTCGHREQQWEMEDGVLRCHDCMVADEMLPRPTCEHDGEQVYLRDGVLECSVCASHLVMSTE